MPLDLLAGIGWAAAVYRLHVARTPWVARYAAPALAVLVLFVQGVYPAGTYPYYLSYYNPVMGGGKRAPEAMFIGWGQGLDQAARYLNETVDTDTANDLLVVPTRPLQLLLRGRHRLQPRHVGCGSLRHLRAPVAARTALPPHDAPLQPPDAGTDLLHRQHRVRPRLRHARRRISRTTPSISATPFVSSTTTRSAGPCIPARNGT